ncbi:MAG: recombination protein RecR, partial [Clostridia bacterium]|nr:recombination protein RecR [Clostridia bacterium]
NISVDNICEICSDEERDHSLVCVVEDAKAVMAFEKVRDYNGVYHVLDGVLSPINGVGPEDINLYSLLKRIGENKIDELIIATNPTVEGEATAMYISRLVSDLGVKVSRLAYGVPVGGDLEYADEVTLHRALEGRQEIK